MLQDCPHAHLAKRNLRRSFERWSCASRVREYIETADENHVLLSIDAFIHDAYVARKKPSTANAHD